MSETERAPSVPTPDYEAEICKALVDFRDAGGDAKRIYDAVLGIVCEANFALNRRAPRETVQNERLERFEGVFRAGFRIAHNATIGKLDWKDEDDAWEAYRRYHFGGAAQTVATEIERLRLIEEYGDAEYKFGYDGSSYHKRDRDNALAALRLALSGTPSRTQNEEPR